MKIFQCCLSVLCFPLTIPSNLTFICIFCFFSSLIHSLSWWLTSPLTQMPKPYYISRTHPDFLCFLSRRVGSYRFLHSMFAKYLLSLSHLLHCWGYYSLGLLQLPLNLFLCFLLSLLLVLIALWVILKISIVPLFNYLKIFNGPELPHKI